MLLTAETEQIADNRREIFQFLRSLMSFVSRNLCHETRLHERVFYVLFIYAHSNMMMLIHYGTITVCSRCRFCLGLHKNQFHFNFFSIFPFRRAKELTFDVFLRPSRRCFVYLFFQVFDFRDSI